MQPKPTIASGVHEGDILAGKYRIDRILGAGGMGVVVAAHHLSLDQRVAIKMMLPEALANAEAVARFAREARAAVKIKSEHVAHVSDVGELPSGAPYMVMEYLEGVDLGDWLEQRGRLSIEQAVEFVLQACEAIAEAHALGIVHRDLKPRNLFVVRRADGLLSVKVLDFGISKTTGLAGSGPDLGMTKTSAVMGSPLYMSPEQMLASRDADSRSDIWALGVILFELLTAALPFSADTMPELVAKILGTTPPPLRTQRPDAPPGLEAVIVRCLERDRGRRFQTIGEFAVALLEFGPRRSKSSVERIAGVMSAAGLSGTSLVVPPSDSLSPPAGAGTAAAWGTTAAKPLSGGKKVAGIALGVVAIAGLAFGVARRQSPASPADTATSATTAVHEPSPTVVSAGREPAPPAISAEKEPAMPPPSASASPGIVVAPVAPESPSAAPAAAVLAPAAAKRPVSSARPSPKHPAPTVTVAPTPQPTAAPAAPPPIVAPAASHPKPASTGWGGRL